MTQTTRRMSSGLRRVLGPAAVFVLWLASPNAALADVTVTPAGKGFDIDVVGQASSSEVLDAIASATGIEIKGTPAETTIDESHLRGASLERAIGALMPHAGFVISSDADGKPTAIIFMATTEDGGQQPGVGLGAGTIPPPVPDGSAPLQPDGGIPDATVGGAPPDDGPSPQDAPPPDGSDQPAPDAAPSGTQGGASGG